MKTKITVFSALVAFLFPMTLIAQPFHDSLTLRVEPEYFSPNGNDIRDDTFFYPILLSAKDVTRWNLQIRNKKGSKVYRLSGAGFSALIKWDGKDKKGKVVPDGEYSGALTVYGDKLKMSSPPVKLVVDSTPPFVEMHVSTNVLDKNISGQEFLSFQTKILEESVIDQWQLQILDLSGRTVYVTGSTAPVENILWSGVDDTTGVTVPQGQYRCAFQAWDVAGNESTPYFLDVVVNVTAREMLEEVLDNISVVETDLGLIVQLPYDDVFVMDKSKPVLSLSADDLLREVALLVNAYPDVNVRLDGYSRKLRASVKDRDRSSLYAWSVYSYLVKKGNVKASRLTVRGRGRSPLFERREIDLEIIGNGVEVILEGNRDW